MLYKVDRASMFNSVEARPLFLNNDIIDAALSISSSVMMEDGQKTILKKLYQNQYLTLVGTYLKLDLDGKQTHMKKSLMMRLILF